MKSLLSAILLLGAIVSQAQSEKFTASMKKNLADFDSAKSTADFQKLANNFERIASAEKTEWLPYYYSGLALSMPAWTDKNIDKDANASKILMLCDQAESLDKNAEICALRNMALTQQMLVDPQTRWASYGQQAGAALAKGKALDPNNPRIVYLEAQNVFGTPEAFGGGKAKAKPLFEKSIELFKQEKPKPLYPNWGLAAAQQTLAQCQ